MIELNRLTKTYPSYTESVHALRDISLHIRPGEIISITGPSGSGKSTLFNILGCLDQPTSGTYQLDGKLINFASESTLAQIRNKHIGLVFQNSNLLPDMTILDNVLLPLRYGNDKGEANAKALEVLQIMTLRDKLSSYPMQLSPTDQQRTALARALVNQPSVLLADEPTGNLDSSSSKVILATLQQLNEELGVTVLIATHNQEVAICTRRVINIQDGVLVNDKVVIQTRLERSS
jgi:putative ABC transport system ATP-binding protein